MYRYQGSYDVVTNNYICFGTSDKNECTSNEDKYMYRIIGVTEDGELKLIKKKALEQKIAWWDNIDEDVTFPISKIFKALNEQDFLYNDDLVPSVWRDKIVMKNWIYGDIKTGGENSARQNGNELYKVETG